MPDDEDRVAVLEQQIEELRSTVGALTAYIVATASDNLKDYHHFRARELAYRESGTSRERIDEYYNRIIMFRDEWRCVRI